MSIVRKGTRTNWSGVGGNGVCPGGHPARVPCILRKARGGILSVSRTWCLYVEGKLLFVNPRWRVSWRKKAPVLGHSWEYPSVCVFRQMNQLGDMSRAAGLLIGALWLWRECLQIWDPGRRSFQHSRLGARGLRWWRRWRDAERLALGSASNSPRVRGRGRSWMPRGAGSEGAGPVRGVGPPRLQQRGPGQGAPRAAAAREGDAVRQDRPAGGRARGGGRGRAAEM